MQSIFENGQNIIKKLPLSRSDVKKPHQIKELTEIVLRQASKYSIANIVSTNRPYGIRTDAFKNKQKYGLEFISETRLNPDDIKIYGVKNEIQFMPRDMIDKLPKTGFYDKYKLFIPKAWGNMSQSYLGGAYSNIIFAKPFEICTETYNEVGGFRDAEYIRFIAKYLMTKYARALLFSNKVSQDTSRIIYCNIPQENFSEPWWDESIDSINSHLFKKYNVPQDIVDFVNDNVQTKTENNIINFNDKD